MTIEELVKKKQELIQELGDMVAVFHAETGVHIESISVDSNKLVVPNNRNHCNFETLMSYSFEVNLDV